MPGIGLGVGVGLNKPKVEAGGSSPVNTVSPEITGTLEVGQTLTCSTGTWTGTPTITYSYQWKRGVTNIGTNSNTYEAVYDDRGEDITCEVTATNDYGSDVAISNIVNVTIESCYYDLSTNKYLNFGNILKSTLTGSNKSFTITRIVKRTAIGTQQSLFSLWDAADRNRSIYLLFLSTNNIQIRFSSTGASSTATNIIVATLTNTTDYYMITLKANMSAGNWSGVKININGIDSPLQVTSGVISSTIYTSNANLLIGASELADGSIVDFAEYNDNGVSVYNTVVSDADLLARYNGGDILPANTIANLVWDADYKEDTWDGSKWNVIDTVGSLDGVSVNVLESDKICVNV